MVKLSKKVHIADSPCTGEFGRQLADEVADHIIHLVFVFQIVSDGELDSLSGISRAGKGVQYAASHTFLLEIVQLLIHFKPMWDMA